MTQEMTAPKDGNTSQHRCDQKAYQSWLKKNRCARFTMLSSMHNDLISEFEEHVTACALWEPPKLKFRETFVIRLCDLNVKFDSYKMHPNHTMKQHLRAMSTMIRELKVASNTLTEEQKIQAGLRSLPNSWETMVISMTHNENIKTFDDISCHLELEAEHLEASKATKATKSGSAYVANNDSCTLKGPKHKNYAPRQDFGNESEPKKAKNIKHSRKGKNGKCFHYNKEGHFARDYTEPRRVLPDFNSRKNFVSTQVMVAHTYLC